MIHGKIIIVNYLPASAMALFPFILIKRSVMPCGNILLNHERIHLQQQIELFIILFYIWYIAEYIFYRIKYKDHLKAYRSIRFEKEAYQHETDLSYLQKRKSFNYL